MKGDLKVRWNVPPDRVLQTALTDKPITKHNPDYMIIDSVKVEYQFEVPQTVTREAYNRLMDDLDDLVASYLESLGAKMYK